MPAFLAHATLPDGTYDMVGDTEREPALAVPGTIAEYAATRGASGPVPTETTVLYHHAGWLFGRTGWGVSRPFEDEITYSLRFGPPARIHGHRDGGSVTLSGLGSRLVLDPGKYRYGDSPFRRYFAGPSAHNLVVVDGVERRNAPTPLRSHTVTPRAIDTRVAPGGLAGVRHQRRVIFSRRLGYLLVEDRLSSDDTHRYRQLWHLAEDADPIADGERIATRGPLGRLVIQNLTGGSTRVVVGTSHPIQGWVSYRYGVRLAAPVVEVTKSGRWARYVTLLAPTRDPATVAASGFILTHDGFAVTITIGDRVEVVQVTRESTAIVDG
jgi:hypothetical protein